LDAAGRPLLASPFRYAVGCYRLRTSFSRTGRTTGRNPG